jgi:hypothetical protein
MMTADDYVDNIQAIIGSSYCLPGTSDYRIERDLGLLNEGQ